MGLNLSLNLLRASAVFLVFLILCFLISKKIHCVWQYFPRSATRIVQVEWMHSAWHLGSLQWMAGMIPIAVDPCFANYCFCTRHSSMVLVPSNLVRRVFSTQKKIAKDDTDLLLLDICLPQGLWTYIQHGLWVWAKVFYDKIFRIKNSFNPQ